MNIADKTVTAHELLDLVKKAVEVDPWDEHLAGNPIARTLWGPGQCIDVHRKLIIERVEKLLGLKPEMLPSTPEANPLPATPERTRGS